MMSSFQNMISLCYLKRGMVLNAGNKHKDIEHANFLKEEFFPKKDI